MLVYLSRVDIERERGGVLWKTLLMRGIEIGGGGALLSCCSALSEAEPLEDIFSSLSLLDLLPSVLDLDDFFSSFTGDADHAPHDEPPSRLILARSFLEDLDSAAGDGGVGGASGTAGG